MIHLLKTIFGLGPKTDFKELMQKGAIILDVRSKSEYQSGHIKGSMNIPVQNLSGSLSKLKKGKPIITCCASGMRSASAKNILRSNGFAEVHNGGAWTSLQHKIRQV
jgi:rhodanese-related sulfurtransferase